MGGGTRANTHTHTRTNHWSSGFRTNRASSLRFQVKIVATQCYDLLSYSSTHKGFRKKKPKLVAELGEAPGPARSCSHRAPAPSPSSASRLARLAGEKASPRLRSPARAGSAGRLLRNKVTARPGPSEEDSGVRPGAAALCRAGRRASARHPRCRLTCLR